MLITASVGHEGQNEPEDVRTVQQLLNEIPPDDGGPLEPLSVNGDASQKTIVAIYQFQRKQFGTSVADGRVDPGHMTEARLVALSNSHHSADLDSPEPVFSDGVERVQALLGQALLLIRGAQTNLLAAMNAVDLPSGGGGGIAEFSREARMHLANRHFDVDAYPADMRRKVLQRLLKTYDTMAQVFQRPGGLWGINAFDTDKLNTKHVAYAYRAGFFRPGEFQFHRGQRVRLDAIYLGEQYLEEPEETAIVVIVHELAHFVGHPYHIQDFAYGWYDRPEMQAIRSDHKSLNAMSYNNFAWNTLHDRPPEGVRSGP